VLTLPIADAAGASAAAQRADAMAVFYGTPDRPLPDALQELAPAVRGRGARVVAVLQRELAAQRDDCFRAGASDLLFMPMPKEQFLSRLADAVALVYSVEPGAPASVQVGARGTLQQLAQATVTASGVHAATALPFQAGETVRLSWSRGPESFEAWGLMVCSAPDAQIRFAGLAPDEEARLRDWLRGAAAASRPPAPPRAPAAPMAGPRAPAAAVAAQRAAPAGGPPPGFADRPRVKETPPSTAGAGRRPCRSRARQGPGRLPRGTRPPLRSPRPSWRRLLPVRSPACSRILPAQLLLRLPRLRPPPPPARRGRRSCRLPLAGRRACDSSMTRPCRQMQPR